jgi:elongation factor G
MSAQIHSSGAARPRAAALVGPSCSGKTTLFEHLLAAADAPVPARGPGVRVGHCRFRGEAWSLVDCPGGPAPSDDVLAVLGAVDIAVVLCEPDPGRAGELAPILALLDRQAVPHVLFVNKIETFDGRARDVLTALQEFSEPPLVLRQVPICEEQGIIGYVDVVSARAYRYRPGEPSVLFSLPARTTPDTAEELAALVEVLAERDADLHQKVLEDVKLSPDEIFRQLKRDQQSGSVVGVLLGAARHEHGVRRLWKALRHDAPDPQMSADRRGVPLHAFEIAAVD